MKGGKSKIAAIFDMDTFDQGGCRLREYYF